MKMFKIDLTIILIVVALIQNVAIIQAVTFGAGEPTTRLAAYSNKISEIIYSVGSDDQYALTFLCQDDPICMYTPLTYEDYSDDSLTKTYFLPRTQCTDSQIHYCYKDLHDRLKLIGIDLKVMNETKSFNYGLRLSFTMQSHDAYEIVKVIDSDKKTVRFDIVAKI
ncbi:MAG: hypothetical protein JO129_02690 [Candidatus Dependentiae bacterium]|nr:hypothetical protein [Candidatus Dependentiae bacterium]